MKIVVNDKIHLSEFHPGDKPAIIEYLNDRDLYEWTLLIPFPYTEKDADDWFARFAKIAEQQGRPVHFVIRGADDAAIGACGYHDFDTCRPHRAEIGYWLPKPI